MSKGYHDSTTPESIRDLWRTPKEIFNYYDKRFGFNLDMAASRENTLCDFWINQEDDALLHGTFKEMIEDDVLACFGARVWCNPPYSNLMPWVAMVTEYIDTYNVTIVMLLPADTSVRWFKLAFDSCTECHFIGGRISFINEETGKPVNGNNKGSVVFVFDPKSPFKRQVTLLNRDDIK